MIGRAAPEFRERYQQLFVCTAAITETFEWRRLYSLDISTTAIVKNWQWIEAEVTRHRVRDPRPETRKIDTYKSNYLVQGEKITNPSIRKYYVMKCLKPSIGYLRTHKETLGIIKPIIHDIKIEQQKPGDPPEDRSGNLLQWLNYKEFLREEKRKKRERKYAEKPFRVTMYFNCAKDCEVKTHKIHVLDIEIFMLYRHVAERYDSQNIIFDKMYAKFEEVHSKKDVYFGMGTHLGYPFLSYMIGSLIALPKGIKVQQPLTDFSG